MATITPFVKRMRTQGGTLYTFNSAVEDIGININERNNVVKMSHYALLNIPPINATANINQNRFNVFAIPGAFKSFLDSGSIKDSRVMIAESFQNYALNLETNLLDSSTYDSTNPLTISERVFWKWLKETGAIRWEPIATPAGRYWKEDTNTSYSSVVQCIGQIGAGAVRTDRFGTYNETYVLIPTSYGQTSVYFKEVVDDNYYYGQDVKKNGATNILGRENYFRPHPDALDIQAYYDIADSSILLNSYGMQYDNSVGSWQPGWWTNVDSRNTGQINDYFIDSSSYLDSGIYNVNLRYS